MARALLLLLLTVVGCPDDDCIVDATRCNGQRVEICDPDQTWGVFLDCDRVSEQSGAPFVCCAFDADFTCLPAMECR